MAITRKLHYKAVNDDLATHVGRPGDIFYDPTVAELRMYDGNPGGMVITGGGTGTIKQTYVDPAPVSGNYMTVDITEYSAVIVTGNITANFTLNLASDELDQPDNGVTVTANMTVIFTNSGSNTYGITGVRAAGSWGGGDTLVSGTPAAGKTVLAQVYIAVTGNGTANPDRLGYVVYTTVNN
jgi:hypothetical protein